MAGLTKEQRAAKEAERLEREAQEVKPEPEVFLVLMQKDGEEIDVHPTCVKAHFDAGWREV